MATLDELAETLLSQALGPIGGREPRFPEATYRLQFHAGFTFRQARDIVAYLRELGDARSARNLAQDTLIRRRRVLGPDDPETLFSAYGLASCLRACSSPAAARSLSSSAWSLSASR